MAGLRPLLLPEAVGQQRLNGLRDCSYSDPSIPRSQTIFDDVTSNSSMLPSSRLFPSFRLPIISSLPVLHAIAQTNITNQSETSRRDSASLYPNIRTKSFSEISSFFSDLENLRTSTPKLCGKTDLSPSDIDHIAILFANCKEVQQAVAENNAEGSQAIERDSSFFVDRFSRSSELRTPLKLRYSTLFNALCIADPTSSDHPIRLQTPAYRLTNLGLPQFTADRRIMAALTLEESQSWSITQERGVDGRPKFCIQWKGILQSFIPGRGRLFLGSQIDITSSLRGMATFETTRRSHEVNWTDIHLESPTISAFIQMVKDIKQQYQRFLILQPKPRSRIPTRSPGSPPAPTLSSATSTSPRFRPTGPSSLRSYPRLTDYAITFASVNIHQDGLGVRINFSRTSPEIAAILERRLGGRDSFEMAVRWGVEDDLLWLMAIPLLEGTSKWWVCFLLDCDDEIF